MTNLDSPLPVDRSEPSESLIQPCFYCSTIVPEKVYVCICKECVDKKDYNSSVLEAELNVWREAYPEFYERIKKIRNLGKLFNE